MGSAMSRDAQRLVSIYDLGTVDQAKRSPLSVELRLRCLVRNATSESEF